MDIIDGEIFYLNNMQNTRKVHIATLYLEPNQFVWYQWLYSRKQIVTWAIFTEEMIAHGNFYRRNDSTL